MPRVVVWLAIFALASLAGVIAAFVFIDVLNFVDPFRPRDDDTFRDYGGVAISLVVGFLAFVLVLFLGRLALRGR
jgi:hypothetical protein